MNDLQVSMTYTVLTSLFTLRSDTKYYYYINIVKTNIISNVGGLKRGSFVNQLSYENSILKLETNINMHSTWL
jgi:hypothetical protein